VIILKKTAARVALVIFILLSAGRLGAAVITDDAGQKLFFARPPERVVSLVPSATEIICFLGDADALAGVTYRDTVFEGLAGKKIIGGPFTPRFEMINDISPDLLIVAPRDLDRAKMARGRAEYPILTIDDRVSLARAEERTRTLGAIFDRRDEAEEIIRENREFIETVRKKTERVPPEKKQRAILLYIGEDGLLTPKADSFQSETIRAAGALTGDFGNSADKSGGAVPLSLEQWKEFNPDYAFTVSSEHAAVTKFLEGEGWRDVPAARNGRVSAFPGALVCRAAAHVGYFAAWLSSEIYQDEFADPSNLIYPSKIISERAISVDIPYVERARVVDSRIRDFTQRTLVIDFARPQRIVSTTAGERDGITAVGNSYSPPQTWSVYHKLGFGAWESDLLGVLGLNKDAADIMMTGADMNNAAVKTASYRDMSVTAIVTGGVESNAVRTSKDSGSWYEPGTINILIMTNHRLSEQAATRAVVTVTEAKTAALLDMDIRSSQSRALYPATGTGTDTVIVVAGEGETLHWTGGHAKMGELIADAVYRGVREAILRQNGISPVRSALERLRERGISPGEILPGRQGELEELLLAPEYRFARSFLEAAFSLSDAQVSGQYTAMEYVGEMALAAASKIAGRPVTKIENTVPRSDLPPVLATALNALGTGLKYRDGGGVE
jgi:adenosylcobinamide amidohydrolase/ABC-type Fe3+-hydroxamate transport system substrate-binding protein